MLGILAAFGRIGLFALETLSHVFRPPFYPRELGHALLTIGYFSLPVVGLTTLFTGGALALQIFAGGARFSAEAVVPQIVAIGSYESGVFEAEQLLVKCPSKYQGLEDDPAKHASKT